MVKFMYTEGLEEFPRHRKLLSGKPVAIALVTLVVLGLGLTGPEAYGAPSRELETRASFLVKAAAPLVLTADPAKAFPNLEEALEIYRRLQDPRREADVLFLLGLANLKGGRGLEARDFLDTGAQLRTSFGDHFGVWLSQWMASEVDRRVEQYDEALARLQKSLESLRSLEEGSGTMDLGVIELMVSMAGAPLDSGIDLSLLASFFKPLLIKQARSQTESSLGTVLTEVGRFEDAQTHFELALAGSPGLGQEEILFRFGQLRRRQMFLGKARTLLQRALEAADRSGIEAAGTLISGPMKSFGKHIEAHTKTRILSELAKVEMLDGRFEESLTLNSKAIEASALEGPARTVSLMEERGLLLMSLGRFLAAEKVLQQAGKLAIKCDELSVQGNVFQSQASLFLAQGRYQEAMTYQEKAAQIFEKAGKPHQRVAGLLSLIQTYQALGMKDRAQRALQEVEQVISGLDFPEAQRMREHLQKAGEARNSNTHLEALSGSSALMLGMAKTDSALPALQILDPLVELWSDLSRFRELEPSLLEAREQAQNAKLELHLGLVELWLSIGYSLNSDMPTTKPFLGEILPKLEDSDSKDLALISQIATGFLAFRRGDTAGTRRAIQRAGDQLDTMVAEIHSEEILTAYLGNPRQSLLRMLVKLATLTGDVQQAFSIAEKIRNRSLLGLLGSQQFRPPEGPGAELIRQADAVRLRLIELEAGSSILTPMENRRYKAELLAARQKYQDLMLKAKLLTPEYRELVAAQEPLSIHEIQEDVLEPGTSLVNFFSTGDEVIAWIIDRSSFEMVTTGMTGRDLQAIPCFLESLARHRRERDNSTGKSSHGERSAQSEVKVSSCGEKTLSLEELYRKLISPIRPYLHHPRIVIVPHDALHYIPFAALKNPEPQGRYVVEDFILSYVPSASVLPYLAKKRSPGRGQALVLGAPTREDLTPLWGSHLEAQIVAEIFDAEVLLSGEATEERLYREGARPDLIHLAAHGVFNGEQPRFSRIALAASEEIKTGRDDGNLEVHELFGDLDLAGVQLVTLSACQTALGHRTDGDEIVGLTRGFFYAGVPAVVSTLWNIDDRASVTLIEALYRSWKNGGPVSEALREAQIRMLSRKETADPYLWAAFGLYGDPAVSWSGSLQREVAPVHPVGRAVFQEFDWKLARDPTGDLQQALGVQETEQ